MQLSGQNLSGTAEFSADRVYRYCLGRVWNNEAPHLVIIGLNPSTADESRDDPTIRRCMGFARRFGYGGLKVVNLFAYRSTEPGALRHTADPVGPDNFPAIREAVRGCRRKPPARVLCAWGAHGVYLDQDLAVMDCLAGLGIGTACLGVTKNGSPKHPLYLPGTAIPLPYHGRGVSCHSR